MDIYTAENCIVKLHSYIKDVAEGSPNLYRPTKERYGRILDMCYDIVNWVSSFLQDSYVEQKNFECSNQDIHEIVQSDEPLIATGSSDSMCSNAAEVTTVSEEISTTIQDINDRVADAVSVIPEDKRRPVQKDMLDWSTMSKRTILYNIGKALSKGADTPKYKEFNECVKLVKHWFECRFDRRWTSFHYNIAKIPTYIQSIAYAYGKHYQDGDLNKFVADFTKWCDQLTDDNSYAVPYELNRMITKPSEEDITIYGSYVARDIFWLLNRYATGFKNRFENHDWQSKSKVHLICVISMSMYKTLYGRELLSPFDPEFVRAYEERIKAEIQKSSLMRGV